MNVINTDAVVTLFEHLFLWDKHLYFLHLFLMQFQYPLSRL